jgi:cation transport ATPase
LVPTSGSLSFTAAILCGSSVWTEAIDGLVLRPITVAASLVIAVAAELAVGEYSTALMTVIFTLFMSGVVGWATRRGLDTVGTKVDGEAPERGLRSRAPIEDVADRLEQVLVGCGLAAGAVVYLVTRNPQAAVSVAIVTACGVGVSTHIAVLTALGHGSAARAVVKGGAYLEALWRCDTLVVASLVPVVTDDLMVRAVYPAAQASVHDVVVAAATAERPSQHPIGQAIVRSAVERRLVTREPDRFSCIQGAGIRAFCDGEEILVGNFAFVTQGRLPDLPSDPSSSTVFVTRGGHYLGALCLAKQLRPDAKRAIAALKSLGIRAHLLTGDSRIATEPIARALMVDRFESDLGSAQRLQRVQDLDLKRRVVVLGDAVEDATALEAAALGVATGSATAVAASNAGVLVLGDDLEPFIEVMGLARRVHRIILVNMTVTFLIDAAGVAAATAGMLSPLGALLMRASVELAGILNASRLAADAAADNRAAQ